MIEKDEINFVQVQPHFAELEPYYKGLMSKFTFSLVFQDFYNIIFIESVDNITVIQKAGCFVLTYDMVKSLIVIIGHESIRPKSHK